MRPLLLLAVAAASLAGAFVAAPDATPACAEPRATPQYTRSVNRALVSGRDLWGDRLLAAPNGPTLAGASGRLAPLLYSIGRGGSRLTTSGVYYLPFSFPLSPYGSRGFALHVADGSEIITRRAGSRHLLIFVGPGGRERYGSCLARLAAPRLADGYLPILQTAYVDAAGVRYRQESFVGRVPGTRSLVSFVHLRADARAATSGAVVRLVASGPGLVGAPRVGVARGRIADVYAAWVLQPDLAGAVTVDRSAYESARGTAVRFWHDELDEAATFDVPERRVLDAERGLLVEEIAHTWRYSVGNPYEELSFAESLDVAEVMAAYGYGEITKNILRFSLRRLPGNFTAWRAGERLLAGAVYDRLYRDREYVEEETPELAKLVEAIGARLESRGLLGRERYSTDIGRRVYGLHGQAVVWQGLLAMGSVWARTGHPELASRCRSLAARLEAGLRTAVRASERRLADGSLFVPVELLDGGKPFGRLTASREGSYWNLVMPYALASGFFPPHGPEAKGLLRYLLEHGSRLLGLVRGGTYRLYGTAPYPVSGTDQVYGLNVSRFLADNDEADQLVLSLYGALAAAMTPNTYISGEGATVSPLRGAYYRTMYLPPNGGSNAAFLETLRLMLVHETRGTTGAPTGLELAFATPRGWLGDGKRIVVRRAPTSFGPVSYTLHRRGRVVHATADLPSAPAIHLRLRLPAGDRIVSVRLGGRPQPFGAGTGTIDLTGRRGRIELDVIVLR